mmetsp:Transcript_46429/g.92135  ORF Transcript_46429/g.92135 Transcript_46429/m.92135 type:complete len:239 (-) Transcript_46429:72-788(-)
MQTAITLLALALMARAHALRQSKGNAAAGLGLATSSASPNSSVTPPPQHVKPAAKVTPTKAAVNETMAHLVHASTSSNKPAPSPKVKGAFLAASDAMARHKEPSWGTEPPVAITPQTQIGYSPPPSSFGRNLERLQRLRDRCLELKVAWLAAPFSCLLLTVLFAAARGGIKEDTEEVSPVTTNYRRRLSANRQYGATRANTLTTSVTDRGLGTTGPAPPSQPVQPPFTAAPWPEEAAY